VQLLRPQPCFSRRAAAKWAEQRAELLPVDPRNIAPPLIMPSEQRGIADAAEARSGQDHSTAVPEDPWSQPIVIDGKQEVG
jgi:hypothetical protein